MHALAAFVTAFTLHGFAPVATEPSGGRLLEGTFPGTVRPGYVYLPPGFDPTARYPLVYLLHGMPGSPGARETALVDRVLPWVDRSLPTVASPAGRVIAGLSAGGYGAFDIALRHPTLFGAVESWSGYFAPLHDGPFKHAGASTLAANNPILFASQDGRQLRRAGVRFFVSAGPAHSHWIPRGTSLRFADELRRLGLPTTYRVYGDRRGEWREQLAAGLEWAFAP